MIHMGVADDDGHDGIIAHFRAEQFQRLGGGVTAAGAVHDDPAVLAAHEGDVGNVVTPHLINLVRYLEQAVCPCFHGD